MKILSCFLFSFLCVFSVFSQQEKHISISIQTFWGDEPFILTEKYYKITENDSVMIETLRFYLSEISFLAGEKEIWKAEKSAYLVENARSFVISIPENVHFTAIKFHLGIDSLTNVSGAMGGDLDPTKGMYWTWQSGYINFKCEGKSNLCTNRNQEFQFHLGGYLPPFNNLKTIVLPIKNAENIRLILDIKKVITSLDLSKEHNIMSPSKAAVSFSKKVADAFYIQD